MLIKREVWFADRIKRGSPDTDNALYPMYLLPSHTTLDTTRCGCIQKDWISLNITWHCVVVMRNYSTKS